MSPNAPNLSLSIANELSRQPFLLEMLHGELINISALAVKLKPVVEAQCQEDFRIEAIAMAIRRYVRSTSHPVITEAKFPAHIDMTVRTHLYEVAIASHGKSAAIADRVRKGIERRSGDLCAVIEGTYETVILTQQEYKKAVQKILGKTKRNSELGNLGAVTVNWPRSTKDIPGIYYRITRALAFNDIAIQSFHTLGSEMMIMVKDRSLGIAYDVLSRVLHDPPPRRRV